MAEANPPIRGKKPKKRTVNPEVKDKILERVAREEKALRIVERLIDNPVSQQLLNKSLRFINQSVYNDIVEERSIIKNCGYPLCQNSLPKVIRKQTYAINAKLNKVYKLEERNMFCSSTCYSYSRNLRDQLSIEPVWLISKSAHSNIKIVPLKPEESDDEELPRNRKIDEKHLHEEVESKTPVTIKEHACPASEIQPSPREIKPMDNIMESVQGQFSWLDLNDKDEDSEDESETTNRVPELSFVGTIRHCLTQWRTSQSSDYLSGSLSTVTTSDDLEDDDDLEGLLDDDLRISQIENKAPLPDISDLKDDSIKIEENSAPKEPVSVIHLPKIDSINQVQQRQSIVISKLQPAIEKILCKTNFRYGEVSSVMIKLVSYLNISSLNCMFTEKQSLVISAILLSLSFPLLSVLKESFNEKQFNRFLWEQVNDFVPEEKEFLELCNLFR